MKRVLTYSAIALLAIALALVAIRLSGFSCGGIGGRSRSVTETPLDTTFSPVKHTDYRVPTIASLSQKKGPARLPEGVSESDVKRVTSLKFRGGSRATDIIELKTGELFVEKDSSLESVTVTEYEAPFLAWEPSLGLGLSIRPRFSEGPPTLSISAGASVIQFLGRVDLPVLCADLDGVGLGARVKFYHDLSAGACLLWRYTDPSEKVIKIILHLNI